MISGASNVLQPAFITWADAGFLPELIPIHSWDDVCLDAKSRGKKPVLRNWTDYTVERRHIEWWAQNRFNVGLRTKFYPCLDVDIDDKAVASAVEELAKRTLGTAPVRTRSNSFRRAVLYRLSEFVDPFIKRTLSFKLPNGDNAKVEFLAGGQQTVVAGMHWTGAPLIWDEQPVACDLPTITKETCDTFIELLRGRLSELDCDAPRKLETPVMPMAPVYFFSGADARIAKTILQEMRISPDVPYDDWIRVGMALHSKWPGEGGYGYQLWLAWSSLGEKYRGEDDVRKHWRSFHGGAVRFATLLDLARGGR